jgi:hypothetical protein
VVQKQTPDVSEHCERSQTLTHPRRERELWKRKKLAGRKAVGLVTKDRLGEKVRRRRAPSRSQTRTAV